MLIDRCLANPRSIFMRTARGRQFCGGAVHVGHEAALFSDGFQVRSVPLESSTGIDWLGWRAVPGKFFQEEARRSRNPEPLA